MNGEVHNVVVFNRMLSATEIECYCDGLTNSEELGVKQKIRFYRIQLQETSHWNLPDWHLKLAPSKSSTSLAAPFARKHYNQDSKRTSFR